MMLQKIFHKCVKAAGVAALMFFSQVSVMMSATENTPDFAFPKTVEGDASPLFRQALSRGEGVEALDAAIQLVVARNMISKSSFVENVNMLDSAAEVLPKPYSSLFLLLEADLYRQLYQSDRWTFNGRDLPLDTYPDDPMAWSGEMFAKRVRELVVEAAKGIEAGYALPIKDIATVITNAAEASSRGLTVGDFIVYEGVAVLNSFGSGSSREVIPFGNEPQSVFETEAEKCGTLARSLLEGNLRHYSESDSHSALAMAVVQMSAMLSGAERVSFLKDWVVRMKDDETDALLLREYYAALNEGQYAPSPELAAVYDSMSEYLKDFPESKYSAGVRFDMAQISRQYMAVSVASDILPQTATKCSAELRNMNSGYVLIYRLHDSMSRGGQVDLKNFPGRSEKIAALPLKSEGNVPFSANVEFELPPLPPGRYVAIPSSSPELKSDWRQMVNVWSVSAFNVSEIAVVTSFNSREKGSGKIYVVDSRTQKPVEGATVECSTNEGKKIIGRGLTGRDGSFDMPVGYYDIKAVKGGNIASQWAGYDVHSRQEDSVPSANILTDLSIYHPGDTVRFVAVAWMRNLADNVLLENRGAKVELVDANGNVADSLNVTTDRHGRCEGAFRIPREGLLGSYGLQLSLAGSQRRIAWRSFQVADYKVPAFFVELKADSSQNYKVGDVVRISGEVKSYSGMPLAGSAVSFNVRWMPWWRTWAGGNADASYGGIVSTDEKGGFTIELPTGNLKGTRFSEGIYSLSVSATSPSGETQAAPDFRFSLGKGFRIAPSFQDRICVSHDSVKLNVPVYDMLGLPSVEEVDCKVENMVSGEVVYEGRFKSPILVLPSSILPSGKYSLSFSLPGDSEKTKTELVAYRTADSRPPYPVALWVPEKEVVVADGQREADIKIGSGYPDSWILCVVSSGESVVSREWICLNDENRVVKIPVPADGERRWVTFSGMRDFDQMVETVSIVPESLLKKLEVGVSAFRDRISAGDREEWKFRFSVGNENVPDVAAFAVMSDKSLNALSPFTWNFNVASGLTGNFTRVSSLSTGMLQTSGYFSKLPEYTRLSDALPEWNTYGYSLSGSVMLRGFGMKRSGAAMTTMAMQKNMAASAGGITEEMTREDSLADAGEAVFYSVESEDASAINQDESSSGLRPVEMPSAFFMPTLEGNADGEVYVRFDVPDFNTTWQFQLMGYTPRLMTAGIVRDVTASKPVMVRSNPPRYLRTGDHATITALLFNNTDSVATLEGEIELFDPASGRILSERVVTAESISPSGHALIDMEYDVASDIVEIGMRFFARDKKFSDGEQIVVPVLPSSTPLVTSVPFYMGSDEGEVSIKIPALPSDANVTFKYCGNPVWECVLSLPSLIEHESRNVLSVVRSLYAVATSSDIIKRFPYVRSGIERALSATAPDGSPLLKSALEKDSGVKMVSLGATPWVNDTSSETARMRSLGLMLSDSDVEARVALMAESLKGLQGQDGGWGWCPGMRSSSFITRQVLLRLGMMNRGGYLPDNCLNMAKKAIKYCDKEYYDNYVKSGRNFSSQDMAQYLYVRSLFAAGEGSGGFRELESRALRKIDEDWKRFSIYDKATVALLFAATRGYERKAGIILESLNQLASKSQEKGWWFDNLSSGFDGMPKLLTTSRALEAYAAVSPASAAVDGLRQWLVLQKETEDWGANPYAAEVVDAILSSGGEWLSDESAPVVTVGGERLDFSGNEILTGAVSVSLDAEDVSSKELVVRKTSPSPVWGGVVSQYVAPITEVKSEATPNLKIEKSVYVVTDTPSGESVTKGPVKVGDKVRVTLTLTCDKDMNYVALTDERAACLEPAAQISGYEFIDGLGMYREVRDTQTGFFIDFLPKGVNVITYDCYADRSGTYTLGIVEVQSQYSPLQTAHSSGREITVAPGE